MSYIDNVYRNGADECFRMGLVSFKLDVELAEGEISARQAEMFMYCGN